MDSYFQVEANDLNFNRKKLRVEQYDVIITNITEHAVDPSSVSILLSSNFKESPRNM